jgi:DNA-binding CsgD family transcriptional regulator
MVQFDIFDTDEQKKDKLKVAEQLALPVAPLQEKLNIEEPTLTDREFEILHMVLSGISINEMALKIFLTEFGIKYRLSHIYFKFGCSNRLELIKKASTKGIQFLTESGIRHSFHNKINMREYASNEQG